MPREHRAPGPVRRAPVIQRPAFRSLIFFSWHDIFFMVQSASQDTNRRKLDNNAPVGTAGNISARYRDVLLITPSATPYDAMTPESIAAMPLDGEYGAWTGPLKPSTEWRFHFDITKARPDVGAIVHTHSTYATVLAIARKEIPACHYMMAAFGGTTIRCAGYARYGTKELSDLALRALEGPKGGRLANDGMIALGANLDKAMWLAVELETIAKQYYLSLALGNPVILSDDQIAETASAFTTSA